jgi:hypothetical protein
LAVELLSQVVELKSAKPAMIEPAAAQPVQQIEYSTLHAVNAVTAS